MAPSGLSARQREIVAAAGDVLAREGAAALTVGRIAQELGIKAPSLYKHFADKREIEAALIAGGFEAFGLAVAAGGPGLPGVAAAYRAFALQHPHLYRLMTERPLPREVLPEGAEARAAAPVVAAVGGDPDLARAVWAFAHGMVHLELAGRFPLDAELDAAWRAATEAFAAAAA